MEPVQSLTVDQWIDKGVQSATEAVRLDSAGQLTDAYRHYKDAVLCLEKARNLARTDKAIKAINAQIVPYLDRAENLLKTVPELAENKKRWEQAKAIRPQLPVIVVSK